LLTSFEQQWRSGPRISLPPIQGPQHVPDTDCLALSVALQLHGAGCPHQLRHFTEVSDLRLGWIGSRSQIRRARVKRAGDPTNEDDANRKREQVFATLRPYSAAWWAVHNEIEADNERRLARKLVICANCLHHAPQVDVTGTIAAD